ncbi:hypothetical protein [Nonomuraea sp. NPDC023979]|uniref:hypothetical protein n=1 Tax=Nonomuraea sp. NPDC023979 TaxID=3154796 RepID=UPI0034053E5A
MRISLQELAEQCGRCGHQNGGHTRSSTPGDRRAWYNAAGGCAVPGCECPGRTGGTYRGDPAVTLTPAAESAAEELRERQRALIAAKPCNYGSGPCGKTPTRPFASGPKCVDHEPVYITTVNP